MCLTMWRFNDSDEAIRLVGNHLTQVFFNISNHQILMLETSRTTRRVASFPEFLFVDDVLSSFLDIISEIPLNLSSSCLALNSFRFFSTRNFMSLHLKFHIFSPGYENLSYVVSGKELNACDVASPSEVYFYFRFSFIRRSNRESTQNQNEMLQA